MGQNIYEQALSKTYKLVQPQLDTNQGVLVENPLQLDYLTAWLIDKDAVKLITDKSNEKNRPVALYDANGVYTFYWHRAGEWYQLGDTRERTALGTKLRYITSFIFREHEPFIKLLNRHQKNVNLTNDQYLELHRDLNLLGAVLRDFILNNKRYGGYNKWLDMCWVKFLKQIEYTQSILVDQNIKINHFTIDWAKLY